MTPAEKIKLTILKKFNLTEEQSNPEHEDYYQWIDAKEEFREGEFVTNIPTEYSRNYESKSVAMKMFDDSWVGWTYWYGGGKYGCPGEIEWMEDAYELTVEEKQEMVTVRTWTKK